MFFPAVGADSGREHQAEAGAEWSQERERDSEAPARLRGRAGLSHTRRHGRREEREADCSQEAGRDGGGAQGGTWGQYFPLEGKTNLSIIGLETRNRLKISNI